MFLPSFSRRLAQLGDNADLARFLLEQRAHLAAAWTLDQGGLVWMRAHANLVDAVLGRLYDLARRATGSVADVVIVATGGYGRRELAPHSDIDLVFVTGEGRGDEQDRLLKEMFGRVMEVFVMRASLKVGYAYRPLAPSGDDDPQKILLTPQRDLDHPSLTALLDARLVAGARALFAAFDRETRARLHGPGGTDFLFRKQAERAAVRAKNNGALASPYVVEPDCKNGAGGLRDLHTMRWMARASGQGGLDAWPVLVRRGLIDADEASALEQAHEFLCRVRCRLHLENGAHQRRPSSDALTRPRQEALAGPLGFDSDADAPGVERFLRRYYHETAFVQRVSDRVVTQCVNDRLPLEGDLWSHARAVRPGGSADALWPLGALIACQTYGLTLDEAAARAIRRAPPLPVEDAGPLFWRLLEAPEGGVYEAVRTLLRVGLLDVVLPELTACMDLIPYDPAHTHTVGEHTLRVLGLLDALRLRGSGGGSPVNDLGAPPAYGAILNDLDSPATLMLAALLHDVGKQWPREGRHAEAGAQRVPAICARLRCRPDVVERVVFLVRHHLVMAETSRLRDLGQPATIEHFARLIGHDIDLLRMLYLLTYADTRAVGEGVWTDVNARFLDELLARTEAWISDAGAAAAEGSENNLPAKGDALRARVGRRLLRGGGGGSGDNNDVAATAVPPNAVHEHIAQMPTSYLLGTPIEEIHLHLSLIARLQAGGDLCVDFRGASSEKGETRLSVVAFDDPRPGFLAKIAGVLYAFDVGVHAAQVFTRPAPPPWENRRIVIDALGIDFRHGPLGPRKRADVHAALDAVLSGGEDLAALLLRRGKVSELTQTVRALHLDDQASRQATIVDITAADAGGVLYRLAARLSQASWNIHAARVSAWGGSARCAFYVTDRHGQKLRAGSAAARALSNLFPRDTNGNASTHVWRTPFCGS